MWYGFIPYLYYYVLYINFIERQWNSEPGQIHSISAHLDCRLVAPMLKVTVVLVSDFDKYLLIIIKIKIHEGQFLWIINFF